MTDIILRSVIQLGVLYFLMRTSRKETLTKDMFIMFVFVNIFSYLLERIDPHDEVSVLTLFVIILLELMIHEFGHVLFAWIIKREVTSVEIGFGKTLLTVGKVKFKMIPLKGKVYCDLDQNLVKALWFMAGGLIVQLCMVPILYFILMLGFNPTIGKIAIGILLIDGLLNLLPIYKGSDGYKMMQILKRMKKESIK